MKNAQKEGISQGRMLKAAFSGLLLSLAVQGTAQAGPARELARSGNRTAACDSISGGKSTVTTTVDPGCTRCSASDAASAADGQARSFSGLTVLSAASVAQGIAIRATAQPGIVYPAGKRAGVFLTMPDNNPDGDNIDSGGSTSFGLATYLDGKLQDSAGGHNRGRIINGPDRGNEYFTNDRGLPDYYAYFETTKPFDAVEVFISDTTVSIANKDVARKEVTVGAAPYKIYEICSDGKVSELPR